MKQIKYFSDNEQGMPPRTLTEINVDIWNVPSTSLYSPNVLRYYRKCFWNSKSKLAASPNGDKPLVPLEIESVLSFFMQKKINVKSNYFLFLTSLE